MVVPVLLPPAGSPPKLAMWSHFGGEPAGGNKTGTTIGYGYTSSKIIVNAGRTVSEQIRGKSITTASRMFGPVGLRQLHVHNWQRYCVKGTVHSWQRPTGTKHPGSSCYWLCYISAHHQFGWYQQCSNESLLHHYIENALASSRKIQLVLGDDQEWCH